MVKFPTLHNLFLNTHLTGFTAVKFKQISFNSQENTHPSSWQSCCEKRLRKMLNQNTTKDISSIIPFDEGKLH